MRKKFRSKYTTVRSRYTSLSKETFRSWYAATTIKFRSKYTPFELFRSQYTPFKLFRSQYTFQIQVHCWHSLGFRSKLLTVKLFRSRYTEFFRPKSTPFFRSKSQGPDQGRLGQPNVLENGNFLKRRMSGAPNVRAPNVPDRQISGRQMSGAGNVPTAYCLGHLLSREPNFRAPNVPTPIVGRGSAGAKCTTTKNPHW